MNPEYLKTKQVSLRDAGKNEKWLQKTICDDPSILGLGSLSVIERERRQPPGGRIDLVLKDPKNGIQYTVEVMLDAVDESHIIRTIEYWDIERRRNRNCEHKAVIIAEEITTRFFNVIRLLNDSIPIIAIQLKAFLVDSRLCMDFVKVLDVTEEIGDSPKDPVTRKAFEDWANKESLKIMDGMVSLIPREAGEPRVKYNDGYTAVSTNGTQFCWFSPRKGPHLYVEIWLGKDRNKFIEMLSKEAVEARPSYDESIKFRLTMKDLEEKKDLLQKILATSEQRSR